VCQEICAANANCTHFSYWPSNNDCWLGGPALDVLRDAAEEVITGPAVCPEESPACTVLPGELFPSTEEIDWPTLGYQPQLLQCFPSDCSSTTLLDSTSSGWSGICKDLTQVSVADNETCKGKCMADMECPGYQIGDNGTCWHGVGWNCDTEDDWDPSWQPVEAGRFMRGSVRVLKELVGIRVPMLQQAFNQDAMDVLGDGARKACADVCYSILKCQYWQLYDGYALGFVADGGCYVDQAGLVPYPLLSTELLIAEDGWVAGEFIQRQCDVPAEEDDDDGGEPAWVWCVIAFCVLACISLCAVGAYALLCQKPKAKKTKKRGAKITKSEPVAAPAPQQQQPLMMYAAMPVQAVTYPVATYQAAPVAPLVATTTAPIAMARPASPGAVLVQAPQPASVMVPTQAAGVLTPVPAGSIIAPVPVQGMTMPAM